MSDEETAIEDIERAIREAVNDAWRLGLGQGVRILEADLDRPWSATEREVMLWCIHRLRDLALLAAVQRP